ncbi:MAG: hypothetical protein PPHEMADM_4880 [uncultured Paraburkholderia sp.]|nr:MAG: hypothetical protein PPHEMADE_4847 [uncultured Paraburkholderia sp.]CAH2940670.1 MAG: hypothetical protein PPHEMADM_4880 [uncultured Paraburkholderia sp.]
MRRNKSGARQTLGSAALREQFLVENVFIRGRVSVTCSNEDRMIFGGIMPECEPLTLPRALIDVCGTTYFLQRRELGLLNLGGPASVDVDGQRFHIGECDALYIGAGAREMLFGSEDPEHPAKLYYVSATAHQSFVSANLSAPARA